MSKYADDQDLVRARDYHAKLNKLLKANGLDEIKSSPERDADQSWQHMNDMREAIEKLQDKLKVSGLQDWCHKWCTCNSRLLTEIRDGAGGSAPGLLALETAEAQRQEGLAAKEAGAKATEEAQKAGKSAARIATIEQLHADFLVEEAAKGVATAAAEPKWKEFSEAQHLDTMKEADLNKLGEEHHKTADKLREQRAVKAAAAATIAAAEAAEAGAPPVQAAQTAETPPNLAGATPTEPPTAGQVVGLGKTAKGVNVVLTKENGVVKAHQIGENGTVGALIAKGEIVSVTNANTADVHRGDKLKVAAEGVAAPSARPNTPTAQAAGTGAGRG